MDEGKREGVKEFVCNIVCSVCCAWVTGLGVSAACFGETRLFPLEICCIRC